MSQIPGGRSPPRSSTVWHYGVDDVPPPPVRQPTVPPLRQSIASRFRQWRSRRPTTGGADEGLEMSAIRGAPQPVVMAGPQSSGVRRHYGVAHPIPQPSQRPLPPLLSSTATTGEEATARRGDLIALMDELNAMEDEHRPKKPGFRKRMSQRWKGWRGSKAPATGGADEGFEMSAVPGHRPSTMVIRPQTSGVQRHYGVADPIPRPSQRPLPPPPSRQSEYRFGQSRPSSSSSRAYQGLDMSADEEDQLRSDILALSAGPEATDESRPKQPGFRKRMSQRWNAWRGSKGPAAAPEPDPYASAGRPTTTERFHQVTRPVRKRMTRPSYEMEEQEPPDQRSLKTRYRDWVAGRPRHWTAWRTPESVAVGEGEDPSVGKYKRRFWGGESYTLAHSPADPDDEQRIDEQNARYADWDRQVSARGGKDPTIGRYYVQHGPPRVRGAGFQMPVGQRAVDRFEHTMRSRVGSQPVDQLPRRRPTISHPLPLDPVLEELENESDESTDL